MQTKNIGVADRYVRLASGLFLMGSALTQRRPTIGKQILLVIGAMKVAEGVMGWCPVMHLAGISETPAREAQSGPSGSGHSRSHRDSDIGTSEDGQSVRDPSRHSPSDDVPSVHTTNRGAANGTPIAARDANQKSATRHNHEMNSAQEDVDETAEPMQAVSTSFQSFDQTTSFDRTTNAIPDIQ